MNIRYSSPVSLEQYYGAANVPKDPTALEQADTQLNRDVVEPRVAGMVSAAFTDGGLIQNGEPANVFLPENADVTQALSHDTTFGWQPGESDLAEAQVKLNEALLAETQQAAVQQPE